MANAAVVIAAPVITIISGRASVVLRALAASTPISLVLFLATVAAGATASFGGSHGLAICSEASCLYGATGTAVDPTSGDVYVAEMNNNRVSKFSASGEFLFAFGYGVRDGKKELETCTLATSCHSGIKSTEAGGFNIPQAVAVDATGNIYVVDFGNQRVEKFDSKGLFVLMFGGGVDQGPHHPGDLCTTQNVAEGDTCGAGTEGNGPGEVGEWAFEAPNVAIGGPAGDVYIGDRGRIDVFDSSGGFKEQLSLASLSSAGRVGSLAVDPSGDMFVQMGSLSRGGLRETGSVPGVHEFEPNGTEKGTVLDPESWASALAITSSGDLYIADPEGGLKILGYHTSSGKHFQSFEPEIGSFALGIAFSGVLPTGSASSGPGLYVSGDQNFVFMVPVPPAGPLIKLASEQGTPEPRGSATLRATVDPEGNQTACRFEYDTMEYTKGQAPHGTTVPCEPANLGESFSNVDVVAHVAGLTPSATYHWRVVSSNIEGTVEVEWGSDSGSPDHSFVETPPALVEGPWLTGVSANAATIDARIDPLGTSTSYSLEYGTSSSTYERVVSGNVGGGEAYVPLSVELTGLRPHTVYHYRLVTKSTVGTVEVPDSIFTTQFTAAGLVLPDQRAWEQVSPPEKQGGEIVFGEVTDAVRAAADSAHPGLAYIANAPVTAEPHTSSSDLTVIATRGPLGWRSVEPMPGKSIPEGPEQTDSLLGLEFPAFVSSDLSRVLIEPSPFVKGLSEGVTERTLYVWDAANGIYTPVVSPADDETGSEYGGKAAADQMKFRGGTPDLSRVVFSSPFALTQGAIPAPDLAICEANELCSAEENLYEWTSGRLRLVNVLPNGKPTVTAFLGRSEEPNAGVYGVHAVSSDGRWVVWSHIDQGSSARPKLYVRDMTGEKTFQVGGQEALYETMSGAEPRVFYLEGGDLHEFDTATHTQADITAQPGHEEGAGVRDALIGASEDGERVYFVATGDLTGSQQNSQGKSALAGQSNLYELHDTGTGWNDVFIATLSGEDEHDWSSMRPGHQNLLEVTSHVSPDGRWLAFMSDRSLTGYDNIDARSGVADEEVFLYDANSQKLVCASCNPTGERPDGILDEGFSGGGVTLMDPEGAWEGHWLAAMMPGWRPFKGWPMYQSRVLLDSGRLFFQSSDALVPQDTNSREDVYEYEPIGVGTCTEQTSTFSSSSMGCTNLISSGVSPQESVFYDASEDGNDVYFSTRAKLAWTDIDEATDVYDARVNGGFPEPVRPPACEGDACQGVATSPIDQTPSSLTFQGPGNVHPSMQAHHRCAKGLIRRKGRCTKSHKRHKAKRLRKRVPNAHGKRARK